jgi:hypothetical protein
LLPAAAVFFRLAAAFSLPPAAAAYCRCIARCQRCRFFRFAAAAIFFFQANAASAAILRFFF